VIGSKNLFGRAGFLNSALVPVPVLMLLLLYPEIAVVAEEEVAVLCLRERELKAPLVIAGEEREDDVEEENREVALD
jgi:hypothetical protein